MRTPKPLPDDLRRAPFSVDDARARGVPTDRLRRRDLARPFHGIRSPMKPTGTNIGTGTGTGEDKDSDDDRWRRIRAEAIARATAYAPKLPAGHFFSHVTASQIHGLPLPARLAERQSVDIGCVHREFRRRGRGVRGHLIDVEHVTVVVRGRLPVASPVDVWCELAAVLTVRELTVLGDALVRRTHPLSTMDELSRAVRRHSRRPGVRKLRAALERVRPRTDSVKETELRLAIVDAGLPEPEINVAIYDKDGFIGLGDLVYKELKILIEYDGGQHRTDEEQFFHDVDRLDRAMAEGWRVIRVHKRHIARRFASAIERIRTALIARGWRQ